ncbi:MAG: VTT domain-containing protein [Geobacteraceae bacterium]|nr:VTT domain-containing protein [Geobacteraceae bacterium]
MSAPLRDKRPMRIALQGMLADEIGGCSGCGVCIKECGFLRLHGSPRELCRAYDPEDLKKNAVCFECSLCGLCNAVCPEKLNPQGLFLEMRREAVERGHGNFPEHKGLISYEKTGTSRRFSWYGLPNGCTTIFFPGCALPGTRPAATMEVYNKLKEAIPALGLVMDCCTKPSHDLGRQEYFLKMFGEMVDWLETGGVKRVLVACPNCYKVFSEYAPQFRTETVYETLADILPEQTQKNNSPPATIHDPCVVRANAAPQAAVRDLLAKAGQLIEEMPHTGQTALCCGEGGTVGALAPDLADGWGERRAAEAAGRRVITYCAGCANHLGKRLQVSHLLDVIFNTPKPSSGPITYLNRLRLKSRFKKIVPAKVTRERTTIGSGILKPLIFLTTLVALIFLVRISGVGQYLEPEKLRALFASFGIAAPLIYIAFYTFAPALMLPGLPISIAGATVFGPVWGVVYTIIGATMGACVAFIISRYFAREWVERRLVGSRWNKLDSETAENGWKAVAFTRLIPLFPFNLLNFAFGLTKIRFLHYAIATFIFMLPGTIAFITFSSSLLGLLKGKVSPEFFIGITLIALVSMLPKIIRWQKSRKERAATPPAVWSLKKSLQRKVLGGGLLALTALAVYVVIQKFFWAIDAYLYTIEFNLLFISSRLKDGDLAQFVEYLRPMSHLRAGGIALASQAMQAFAAPFSALKSVVAFATAFGTTTGLLLSWSAAVIVSCAAVCIGRFLLGDILPLLNRSKGLNPLSPCAAWLSWSAALILALPPLPLVLPALLIGAIRLAPLRTFAIFSAGLTVRILISVFTG